MFVIFGNRWLWLLSCWRRNDITHFHSNNISIKWICSFNAIYSHLQLGRWNVTGYRRSQPIDAGQWIRSFCVWSTFDWRLVVFFFLSVSRKITGSEEEATKFKINASKRKQIIKQEIRLALPDTMSIYNLIQWVAWMPRDTFTLCCMRHFDNYQKFNAIAQHGSFYALAAVVCCRIKFEMCNKILCKIRNDDWDIGTSALVAYRRLILRT